MISQTWFGRFLCWLGIHQVVSGQNEGTGSLYGGCVRCNKTFGWDL
jgi:hypothetical protein